MKYGLESMVLVWGLLITSPLAAQDAQDVAAGEEAVAAAPDPGLRLVIKYDWTLTTSGGGGGAVGLQFDQFEVGVMAFATPLPPFFRDVFLSGAQRESVTLNWGAEVYFQWYPEITRNWLFVGGLISFDGFELSDGTNTSTLYALYAAPRVGLHIPLGIDWIFFEPSIGAAIRVWDSSLGNSMEGVSAQPVAPLTFLSIGGAIPL